MDESFDGLLAKWRRVYEAMQENTAPLQHQIDGLLARLREMAEPYKEEMAALEEQIKPRALAWGKTYKEVKGVEVAYRSGYDRVSWDTGRVDTVLAMLRDLLPNMAESLQQARKVSYVAPSVTLKAVDKED